MNRRRMLLVLALVAVLVLALSGWLVPWSRNSQAAPAPSGDAAFKGKVLLVTTDNMMMAAFILEKAQVRKIGDGSWLVGKGAELEGGNLGWCKGRTVRVQMEHIVSITEFDDLKDFKKAGTPIIIGGGYAPAAATPPASYPAAPVGAPVPVPVDRPRTDPSKPKR